MKIKFQRQQFTARWVRRRNYNVDRKWRVNRNSRTLKLFSSKTVHADKYGPRPFYLSFFRKQKQRNTFRQPTQQLKQL